MGVATTWVQLKNGDKSKLKKILIFFFSHVEGEEEKEKTPTFVSFRFVRFVRSVK